MNTTETFDAFSGLDLLSSAVVLVDARLVIRHLNPAAENLFVLDDACQGFGATYNGRRLGSIGLAAATSFFPAKPLGCYGDGGAMFTNDDALAERLRSFAFHGKGETQ